MNAGNSPHTAPNRMIRQAPVSGLTLIEVLVVVLIIGTLSAIGLPAINAARVKARQAKCANNMRQIGVAMISYACDNQGFLPTSTHGSTLNSSWIVQLRPFVGASFDTIRICPADPRGADRLRAGGTSYVLNEYIAVDRTDPFGAVLESYRNLDSLPQPSRTLFVFTVSDSVGVSGMNDHTHSRNWNRGWNAVIQDIQPDRHKTGSSSPDKTTGSANYLYGDGRVESISAADLKKLFDQNINPAIPPT